MTSRSILTGAAWLLATSSWPLRAQDTLPHASLVEYVSEVKGRIPASESEGFVAPSEKEMATFVESIRRVLAGDVDAALPGLKEVGYSLLYLHDEACQKAYLVVEESADPARGLGTCIVDLEYDRNVIVAVPHPRYDLNTSGEGRKVFQGLGARGLFLAGTHRCANSAPSPCSGRTRACEKTPKPHRISDAAHFSRTFLQAAHQAALRLSPVPAALNLHGMSSDRVDVVLSDGTRTPATSEARVNILREGLVRKGVSVASCNWAGDSQQDLCGTTNVQGRLYNGSDDPCAKASPGASGRFLHLEQSRSIRKDPSRLIAALKEVFPVERPCDAGNR